MNKVKGTHIKYQFNVLPFYIFYEFIFVVSFVFSPPTLVTVLPFIDIRFLRKLHILALCSSCLYYFLSVSNSPNHLFPQKCPLSLSGLKYKRLFFYPIVLKLFPLLTCTVHGIPIFILTNHIVAAVSNPFFVSINYLIELPILHKRSAHCFSF